MSWLLAFCPRAAQPYAIDTAPGSRPLQRALSQQKPLAEPPRSIQADPPGTMLSCGCNHDSSRCRLPISRSGTSLLTSCC